MLVATPSDVTTLQTQIQGYITELANAMQSCATTGGKQLGDLPARFTLVAKRAAKFLVQAPSWLSANQQYAQGNAVLKALIPFYGELTAAGCTGVPTAPDYPAPDPSPGSLLTGYGELVGMALALLLLHEWNKR